MLDEAKEIAKDNIIYMGRVERRPIRTSENTKGRIRSKEKR